MQNNCSESAIAVLTPPHEGEQHKVAHIAYQLATVLAILLFLISFWSC